ncbi:hypothetical protein YSA_09113 [Pseudomonas putida ND6]|uniref:Uncharacterized protein n=1 Tax=Pseudomonas putida ND6 TaxID=231023 RepID=I3V1S9_PSEPU|nr:hypothetical protein YSA_09113 [Pseudomonas putida ND6]
MESTVETGFFASAVEAGVSCLRAIGLLHCGAISGADLRDG